MRLTNMAIAAGRQAAAERAATVTAAPFAAAPTERVRVAAAAAGLPSQPDTRGSPAGAVEAAPRTAGSAQI